MAQRNYNLDLLTRGRSAALHQTLVSRSSPHQHPRFSPFPPIEPPSPPQFFICPFLHHFSAHPPPPQTQSSAKQGLGFRPRPGGTCRKPRNAKHFPGRTPDLLEGAPWRCAGHSPGVAWHKHGSHVGWAASWGSTCRETFSLTARCEGQSSIQCKADGGRCRFWEVLVGGLGGGWLVLGV